MKKDLRFDPLLTIVSLPPCSPVLGPSQLSLQRCILIIPGKSNLSVFHVRCKLLILESALQESKS